MKLEEDFIQRIIGVHKEAGRRWLDGIDDLIAWCEEKWSVQVLAPFPLSYNFAEPAALNDGKQAVIKLCVPAGKEFYTELEAIRLYNGNGMARLLDADEERGALLLERLCPGLTLKSVESDDEAVIIAANIMKKLNIPVPAAHVERFPSVAQWAKGLTRLRERFGGGTGPIPERTARKAEELYPKLIATIAHPVLLHGDLHHENILSAEREPWLAIDPKGLIGEAEYGVIQFLMNHLPESGQAALTKRRIEIFAEELGLRQERIAAWAFCHSVLSAWWCIEDNADVEEGVEWALRMADIFDSLME